MKQTDVARRRRSAKSWLSMLAGSVVLAGSTCLASTVTLQWDPVAGGDVAGYKVYYKADSSAAPLDGTEAVQGAAPVDAATQTTATISGLDPAHAYYFAVTAYNAAGVESAYSNLASIPELTPPVASITYPPNDVRASGTVSVTASASDNTEVTRVEFYLNGVLQVTDTTTPYLYSWDTAAFGSGVHTLSAKAYDAAGNVGVSGSVSVTVVNDSSAPAVSLTSPGANATLSGTVSLAASASDDLGVSRVEFYQDGALLSAGNVAPYSYSWNTGSVANGSHTLSARAYDATGNVGQSANVAVTVNNPVADSTAPTVSLTAPAKDSTVGGTVSVSVNASDNLRVSKVQFYVNGALQGTDTTAPYAFSWKTSALANGAYLLSARAYDAAGNVGRSDNVAVTVLNDSVAPTVSLTAPSGGTTVGGTVSVTASASDNVAVGRVQFYLNGVLQSTSTAAPYSFNWDTRTVANGACTLSARAYDTKGNLGQAAGVTVTVYNDTIAPVVSLTAPVAGATVGGTVSVPVNASDNAGVSQVEFYLNGTLQSTLTAAPYAFTWNTLTAANGAYTLSAKAYDAAGNVGQSAYTVVTVFNDTQAPSVTLASPVAGATVGGAVSVAASASDNVGVTKVEFYLNGTLQASSTSAPYAFTWNTLNAANGAYTLSAKAYDAAGNVGQSASSAVTVFNDTQAPSVTLTAPVGGASVSGAIAVTASASDNAGVTKVEFYLNGTLQASSTSAPYSFIWNTLALANGAYTVSAKAYDAAGNLGQSGSVAVSVNNVPLSIDTSSLTAARVGGAYSVQLAATGGKAPYSWSVASGSLPAGLSLNASNGAVSGTATASGVYSFSVRATDANGATAARSLSLAVKTNVAPLSSASASSQNTSTGQLAGKAIDGVISGYPVDYTKEWATVGQLAGAWIQLKWSSSRVLDQMVLYDRPNLNDQVTAGTLTFSDGSSVAVGALANDGSATTVSFPAKTVTWVKFSVTKAQGQNVGLSEFQAIGY